MLMMHEDECDFEKITGTYPKGKDGRNKSPKTTSSELEIYPIALRYSWQKEMPGGRLLESRGAPGRVPPPRATGSSTEGASRA
jgi:hypothetical protein